MSMFNGVDLVLCISIVVLVIKMFDLRKQVEILLTNLKTSHRELNDLRIRYDKLKQTIERHTNLSACPYKNCNRLDCHGQCL